MLNDGEGGGTLTVLEDASADDKIEHVESVVPESEIVVAILIAFFTCVLIIVHRWKNSDSKNFFQAFLLKEAALRFLWNVLLPIGYISKKKDMRKYVKDYICFLIRQGALR